VRVYDQNNIPNRSTRAVGVPEDQMLYEDNPRSDYDTNTHPGIALGGYGEQMDYAKIVTEVEFSPNGIGKFFLWTITTNHGCSLETSSSGSFANGKTISHVVRPSGATRASHNERDDIVISVGFDKNGDGILQNEEKSVPAFNNTLIGKKEYDYCYSQLASWQNYFGGVVWPDAGELIRIFTGLNYVAGYNSSRTIIQEYGANHSQDQSNGLGFDENFNLKQGAITQYIWNAGSEFSNRILQDLTFYNKIILDTVKEFNIGEYYKTHPYESTHIFSKTITTVIEFPTESGNLHNSLKHADISFELTLDTERGNGTPRITGIFGKGACTDLYDFRTYGASDNNGFASRVQTCHVKGVRDAGEIFSVYVNLNIPDTYLVFPRIKFDYNDYANLYLNWLLIVTR
jgi:hypothetical protein